MNNKLRGLLFALALAVLSPTTQAQLRVEGVGETSGAAKRDAFRRAIEYYSGSAIISSTRVEGGKLTEDSIWSYSSGYIRDYTVVSQRRVKSGVVVVLDVYPGSSVLHGSAIQSNRGSDLKGSSSTALQTHTESRNSGRALLGQILGGWPNRAIKVDVVGWQTGHDGEPYIDVALEVSLNQRWAAAMEEAIFNTSVKPENVRVEAVAMFTDLPADRYGMTWRAYGWPNYGNLGEIRRQLTVKQPYIRVWLEGANNSTIMCGLLNTSALVQDGHRSGISTTRFYLGQVLQQTERIYINSTALRGATRINAEVVTTAGCQSK